MSQTLRIPKGIVSVSRRNGLGTLAAVVLALMLDRMLKDVADPMEVSDMAEATGASRAEVVEALQGLHARGLVNGAQDWDAVNTVQPSAIILCLECSSGLFGAQGNLLDQNRDEQRTINEKVYLCNVESAMHDGETLYYWSVTHNGSPFTAGTENTEADAWNALNRSLPTEGEVATPRKGRSKK